MGDVAETVDGRRAVDLKVAFVNPLLQERSLLEGSRRTFMLLVGVEVVGGEEGVWTGSEGVKEDLHVNFEFCVRKRVEEEAHVARLTVLRLQRHQAYQHPHYHITNSNAPHHANNSIHTLILTTHNHPIYPLIYRQPGPREGTLPP